MPLLLAAACPLMNYFELLFTFRIFFFFLAANLMELNGIRLTFFLIKKVKKKSNKLDCASLASFKRDNNNKFSTKKKKVSEEE